MSLIYRCKGCQEEKPLEAYYVDKRRRNNDRKGAYTYCIECWNVTKREKWNKQERSARPTLIDHRQCTKCHETKSNNSFSWSARENRYKSNCKQCEWKTQKVRNAKNPQAVKLRQTLWVKNNPDKVRAKQLRYKLKHPEKVKERQRRNNREYYSTQRGKDIIKICKHRRRAREHSADRGFSPKEWDFLRAAYGQRCAYCGKKRKLSIDHVIPISKGGLHEARNIVPACLECNHRKHTNAAPSFQLHILQGNTESGSN